jgi:prevent-host-death family protein
MAERGKIAAEPLEVSVGELKDRLSEYLRAAESGRVVTVLSHKRPVARLVPVGEAQAVTVRKALRPWGTTRFPHTGASDTDSTSLLLEELDLVALGRPVLVLAGELRGWLGTLGAIHLATATIRQGQLGERPVLATHDPELASAARSHGFSVIGVA